jgi:hypothetical protein
MAHASKSPILAALSQALYGLASVESVKLADEADAFEAAHGEDAIECVRARIVSANRSARRDLYRLHDELARRSRERAGDPLAGLRA